MARTNAYLNKKAMEAFIKFSDNPDCQKCPMGFDGKISDHSKKWQRELQKRTWVLDDVCGICSKFFNYKVTISDLKCPCHRWKPTTAFRKLKSLVNKFKAQLK